jgi:RimJ/RimL family protein N-acetyltransferase
MSSPHGLVVRSARWGDFDDLRDTYFRLYDERAGGEPIGITLFAERPTLADEVSWFEGHFRRALAGEEIFLVAELDGHVVGSCTIGRVGPGPGSEVSHVGELGILVHLDHRGKGVGTALLERSLYEARSKFEVVFLSVFSVNEVAQRLYRRFGFSVCRHLPRHVKRGGRYFDEERMVLDLSSPPEKAGANR